MALMTWKNRVSCVSRNTCIFFFCLW